MVEIMLTTLITGSPRGLGDDPELKVQLYIRSVVCLLKVIKCIFINLLLKIKLLALKIEHVQNSPSK